jgi:hypothetical protein
MYVVESSDYRFWVQSWWCGYPFLSCIMHMKLQNNIKMSGNMTQNLFFAQLPIRIYFQKN